MFRGLRRTVVKLRLGYCPRFKARPATAACLGVALAKPEALAETEASERQRDAKQGRERWNNPRCLRRSCQAQQFVYRNL